MNFSFKLLKTSIPYFLVLLFCLIGGLLLRLQTIGYLNLHGYPIVLYEDPWYSIRQIEQIAHNFPLYAWFDPFLDYPLGKDVYWGPVFPISAAIFSMLSGAITQPDIIQMVSWIPPFVLIPMIPVCYSIGKNIWNKKAGFLAAIMVCFVSGEFLFRTQYGYVDHHCFETLFFFAFLGCYLLTLLKALEKKGDNLLISKEVIIFALISGIIFYLGIMNMPTMLISGVIVTIFTLIFALFSKSETNLFQLCQIHTLIFGVFSLLYGIFGLHYSGLSLQGYSIGLILVSLLIILGTWYLFVLYRIVTKYLSGRWNYSIFIGGSILFFCLLIYYNDFLASLALNSFGIIFSDAYTQTRISELKPIPLTAAFHQYNLAFLLSIIGFFILISKYRKTLAPAVLLFLVTSVIITFISFNQIRYQYYEGPVIALLSGITLAGIYSYLTKNDLLSFFHKKDRFKTQSVIQQNSLKNGLPHIIIGIILITFIVLSTQVTLSYLVLVPKYSVYDEKVQSLLWLKENSPEPDLDYLKIYDKKGFIYPDDSYTVLNWWGDGHYITTLSKRMPVSTPLQDNGAYAATEFYLASNEYQADRIINPYKSDYVIVDIELYALYEQIHSWVKNPEIKTDQVKVLYLKRNETDSQYITLNGMTDSFFESMFVRLFQFDGTAIKSEEKNNFTFVDVPYANSIRSVVIPEHSIQKLSSMEGVENLKQKIEVSFNSTRSTIDLPALTGYRLIYESPKIAPNFKDKEIHNIKIFEHVRGHTIPGTGMIELPIVTNQGREFIYRQQSENNTFTLPYSTINTPYDVHATGPYRIIETNETIDVDESQIERYYK